MKEIKFENIQDAIIEIINNLESILNSKETLNILKNIDVDLFTDQLKEEQENGVVITKTFIKKCIIKTLKDKFL